VLLKWGEAIELDSAIINVVTARLWSLLAHGRFLLLSCLTFTG